MFLDFPVCVPAVCYILIFWWILEEPNINFHLYRKMHEEWAAVGLCILDVIKFAVNFYREELFVQC